MDESNLGPSPFEEHGRRLFDESVERVDMRVRSRLNVARHAALDAARGSRSRFFRVPVWTSAAGVTVAGVLAVAIWFGGAGGHADHAPTAADTGANLEDLELVASSDDASAPPMDMLQEDVDFYEWAADKGTTPDSGNVG
jgi:hypothetical protein